MRGLQHVTLALLLCSTAPALRSDDPSAGRERQLPPVDESTREAVRGAFAEGGARQALDRVILLGPALAGTVFDLAVGRIEIDGVGPEQEELLRLALAKLRPPSEVGAVVVSRLAIPPDYADALVACGLLSEVGDVRSILGLVDAVGAAEVGWGTQGRFQGRVEEALRQALPRDAEGVRALREWLSVAPPALTHGACLALVEGAGLPGLELVRPRLGRDAALDLALLDRLAGVQFCYDPDADRLRLAMARTALSSDSAPCRRQALRCLAAAHDDGMFEEWVALLGDADRGVAQDAHDALRDFVGRDAGGNDGAGWMTWYRDEERWLSEVAPARVVVAQEGEAGPALRAMRDLASHPLARRQMAEWLAPALWKDDVATASAACDVLAQAQIAWAVPHLREVVRRHADRQVVAAAQRALRALGVEDPDDARPQGR